MSDRRRTPPSGSDLPDPLHKATLTYKQHGVAVELEVLEGVFASAGVDSGTRHLLRWLADERYASATSVLDVGCGYGPLALWLAAADPDRRVVAIDRDARAVEATALGVGRNRLGGRVEVAGSLGYDDVDADRRFDLVVTNIPAKIGGAALEHLLLDARHRLTPGGSVAVVVVDRLAESVAGVLADDAVDLVATHPIRAYATFEYRFSPGDAEPDMPRTSGFERGVYRRGRTTFRAGTTTWDADVSYSIPEFDTLGRGTLAAIELLPQRVGGPMLVADVGQGHLALALRATGSQGQLRLVDRDILALRTAAANLDDGDLTTRHRGRLVADDLDGTELAVVALPEREPVAVTAAVLGAALAGSTGPGEVVLHGRSADLGRVLELLPRHGARMAERARARHGSHGAVRLRLRPR